MSLDLIEPLGGVLLLKKSKMEITSVLEPERQEPDLPTQPGGHFPQFEVKRSQSVLREGGVSHVTRSE